jgi:hypothetical protein
MSKSSRHKSLPLEVTIMFEPHRLQHDLLQAAYALLVPLPRRRLTAPQPSPVAPSVEPPQRGERNVP